jgi:hypothetical protein
VDRLDGKPVVVDPGRHVFRYELPGATASAPVEVAVLVRSGEQNREVTAVFSSALSAPPAATRSIAAAEAPAPSRGPSPLVWVLGGAAVASLGTSLAFVVAQDVEYDRLASSCKGHCTPDQVSPVSTERTIAALTAAAGGVSLAAAACVFLLDRPAAPSAAGAPLSIEVAPGPRAVLGSIIGRF